ncbi:MAG: hypothetical protein NVSMB2_00830 [Chloroflexota bacterium]
MGSRKQRLFAAGLAALLVLASACSGGAARSTLSGKIAWPKDGDLWVYDLASRSQAKITNLPQGAAVTGASWAPDGTRVIFSQFWRRPNERSSGADLMVANADGSNAQVFAERDAANTVLDSPQWAPSGRVYYTVRRVTNGRESQSVVRQADGGQPETVVDNGYNAAVSADEVAMVYLRNTRAGQVLMKKTLNDTSDGCELLSDAVFQYLSLPRFSPDGTRVALGGSGEANLHGLSGCGGDPKAKPAAAGVMDAVGAALSPPVAEAHGLPADIYTLRMDGSSLTRVADIKDDDPSVAWSADSSKLVIFGVAALFLVDSKGSTPEKLVDQGGYGGVDWAP